MVSGGYACAGIFFDPVSSVASDCVLKITCQRLMVKLGIVIITCLILIHYQMRTLTDLIAPTIYYCYLDGKQVADGLYIHQTNIYS